MADNDNRYKLWQTISKEYDLPDYNQFSKDMEDATKRKSLHDAVSAEYDLPDFDQFSKDMGYETQTTQQGNQNAQNAKKPQQTAQSSHVEEDRGLSSDNGYSKQKTAFDKATEQAWEKLAYKGGIKWTIKGHPEVKMVAVTDDLVKKFPQLEQWRGYQVPFNTSTGTPIMQNIDDKGNIITPDEASEQYTKILTNQDFDYVPKQETAAVQIGSVVNTALSTKGGWLDRAVQKAMEESYGKDWKNRKYVSDGKETSSSEIYAKAKQGIYDNINGVLGDIRKSLLFSTDEQRRQTVDELYQKGYLKEDFLPKANALHYISNVDKGEQVEELRQRKLKLQVQREMVMDKLNQIPQPDHAENMAEFYARRANDGSELYASDLRKIDKQIAQYNAVIDELEGRNNLKNEWGHAVQTSGITDIGAWDFGVTDLKDAMMMYPLAKKMQNGENITQDDFMSLKLLAQANEADAVENAVMPSSYNMFKGSLQSVPYTVQFGAGKTFAEGAASVVNKAATRAVKGAILKAGSKKALRAAEKVAEKAAESKILKFCGMLGKDFEKAFVMENTTGAATTGAEILNRHIGTVTESDDGFKMEGESLPTAIIKGEMSQNIESQTEFLGEHFPSSLKFIRGMAHTKVGSAMGLRNLAAWLTKVSRTEFATTLKSYATRAGINGVFGEYLEEVAGTAENALLVGDQKFSDLLDVKQQEEVAGSVVLSCLGMGIFGTAIYSGQRGLNMPTYYRLQHLQNKWDNAGLDLFSGEEWANLKDRIDNTPNEGMKFVMADILRGQNMTEEQMRAAYNYASCTLTLRGMNIGAMKAAQLGLTDDRHIEQDNAYVEGRQAKDEDKHDIQIEFEDRSHELAEKLGISEQQLDNMSDEDLESLTGRDDQLDNLIYDYQTSHAKYQGVVDNADDEIDKAAQEAARQTDMATDKSRGTVRNATIKAAKGEEDYGVYIVSGNVATNEDGSINVSESDDMILYYDPKSGKIEHCDAMRLASLGEEVNAEETRNQAIADAKEKAIRQQAGIIDGTVGEGTSFTITDAEGNEHSYEVLADNGDGSAMITMDGNVQEAPVSLQDLQNLKDAEEAKRLEAAKMQRQQYEEEREKQNAPVEDNLDYADIINTNGNVEIAEMVDEEGNAMFPDAEEVFFVQNQGNRAKVMVLDSEGNLQPKLVKKSSVRTLGTMSVDEYRQGRQQALKEAENASEPSLVDETETSNNVVPTGNITTDNTTTNETQPGNEAEVTTSNETQNISNEQENTPKITLEDGTEVPMLEDGNPDFSQLTAGQVAELYDSQFGDDAEQIVSGNVNKAKKALDKANGMTVSGGSFAEQKASKKAKDKAIAEAKEKYDSAKAIADAYNERMLAKEEDSPEGRMNLIEKARRKFNRMKGSVKDNAQAIAQLYDETVGALLHRLYDSTGIDVFDDTANTVDEYVASSIAPYSLNYEGTETSKGVKQETGLSRSDFAKTGLLAKEGKGKTIGQLANDLWRDRPANLENITDQDVRNAIIDLITSGQTAFGLKNHIQNLRIAEAENILEQQKRQADELAHAEKQKEEEQASTEQADDKTEESSNADVAPAEEQAEDNKSDLPFEAPSPDENSPFSAKDKAKDPLEVWNNMTDEEKAAYIEKNRVKDTRLVDDVVGKKLRKAIEKIAEMMGATIQWQRTDMIRNGWFNPNTKTIYLALDSSVLWGVQFVFGHEMTHDIKTKSPAMYDELKGLVKEKYGEELFEAKTNDNEKRYAGVGKTDNDRSYYEEETVADAIGKMINDLNLTHSIALKMSHPLLAKMHDVLLKVKNALMATSYTEDVNGIIRTIEQVYVKTANGTFESSASEESYGERLSAKQKRALETVTIADESTNNATAISSADGAKVQNNLEILADNYEKRPNKTRGFITDLSQALNLEQHEASHYGTFETRNGNLVTIRVSNHNARVSFFDENGEENGISIVISSHKNKGMLNDGKAHLVEYFYPKQSIERSGSKPLADIVKCVSNALDSGKFDDTTGIAQRQEVNMPNSDENVSYSLRQKPEPEKKGTGYKVFVLGKDGKLYPPMVANPNGAATPVGVWLDADAAPVAGESKTGRPQVKQGGKGTQGGSGKLAYRPGWHLGVIPYAIQFNRKDAEGNKTLFPKNFVFAEVEYAADKDYQDEAHAEGINSNGKYQHSLAGLKHLPTDGYYMYRTNPNPETDPWVITGAMKVNRLLTRAEQADIVRNAGREPQKIQEGDIVTDDVVNSINQEIAAAPKFSLKVYHGTGADFTEFDFDHMGEGAGSQSFGWGGYVTSSKKIGKSYATLMDNDPSKAYYRIQRSNGTRFTKKYPTLESFLHGDKQIAMNDKFTEQEKIDYYNEMKKLAEPYHNLYEVDIPDDNGSNYLEWEKKPSNEVATKIIEGIYGLDDKTLDDMAARDIVFRTLMYDYIKNADKKQMIPILVKTNGLTRNTVYDNGNVEDDMRFVYNRLSNWMGSPKAASKFLSSLGFTGIKYPAGTIYGGAKEGDVNYVIFKPEDMQIVEHEKFSVKSDVDNQGNPLNQDGTLKLEKIKSVDELTDEDFLHPTRNVELPSLPKKIADAIGTEGKPVVIKKNIFERNYMRHKDVTPELSKKIFKSALYNPDLYGQNQKKTRPYNWVLINTKDEKGNNRTVLLEVNPNKDNVEIVHWHFIDERGLKKIRKQVDREDGQLLILPSDKEEVGALSDPTVNLSAANIANPSETSKGNAGKFSLRLQNAINETDTEPTEAQKKSGNYKKGHVKFGGYDYTIENPKGSYRSGVDENGKEWKQKMNDTYGYIRGKFGKDGDHLDMFINDNADLDNWNGDVFVVDQVNPDGKFDEHKVMYGYDSLEEAKKAYLSNYEKGWTGLGNITPVSKAGFDKWLDKSNRKLKPFADYADITSKSNMDTAPSSFEEFLEHPAVRYSIRNEKERAAAEDAYNFAQENRSDRYSRYAIVNMEKPGAVPQYLEKKAVADNWRRYYNKLKWGNYKLFDLDKPFEDNVKNLVGKFPETFRKKNDTTLSKINELTADYNKRKEEYDAMSNSIQELLNGLMKQGRSLAEAESVIRDWGLYKEMDSKYQNLMGIRKQLNELRSGKVADDERFSLIGKKGAEALDHAEEVSTRLDNLNVARQMEGAKKDVKAIKMATGWERGADGKWRYEIADSKLNDMMDVDGKGKMVKRHKEDMLWTSGKLGEVVVAPELFKAYPKLKDVRLETDSIMNNLPSNGEYNAKTNTITIHADELKYLDSILNHEIQHVIQDLEGFAQGGDSKHIRKVLERMINENQEASDYAKDKLKEWVTLTMAADRLSDLYKQYINSDNEWLKNKAIESYWDAMNELDNNEQSTLTNDYPDGTAREIAESGYHVDEAEKELRRLAKETKESIPEGNNSALDLVSKLTDALENNDDYNLYRKLGGEVEARNVQSRMGMSPEERRKTLAEETEDVARKDQIFLYGGSVSMMGSRAFNEAINSSDNIRFSLKSMMEKPEGWKQANKKAIHIAEAIERDPKFSLKNLDGTLIKAGTYFSGGGLVEEGLKGIIDPVVAVEYDEKISGVYRNNFGNHIVTADVRDVDPKELVGKIDGEVEYFHASPVCKNYSLAKNNHEEQELDKETAASTAEFISKVRPKVVTIENVKGYKDSEAMKTITDALDEAGYKWDADVYNAADYGGYTNRERLIVRAVRDGELPAKPEKQKRKSGWYEAVEDIMPTLTEKKNGVAPWMDERLKAYGIDWRHIDKPLYVMGSGYANGTVPHAFADELLPTLRTKSGDVIVMPDGKVYRAMGRVLARVSGVSDDYQMPASEALSHTIIGNGIPTQLTENVIAPLVRDVLHPAVEEKASLKDADRKQTQLDIILKTNPMLDDYHTGIRKVEDIKTLGESVEEARSEAEKYGDDEWSAYPDITNDMLQNALETGEITIYSSKPIKNGVFVTPSYMQASDYAGGGNVYEKTVPLTDVAWINTDEGQYAKVDGERYSLKEVNDINSKSFKQWFGDWENNPEESSQMLDEEGKPKVFYHNTDALFNTFNPEFNGTNTDAGWLGDGFYFYGDENEGNGYGKHKMAVYLNIRNPYYATSEDVERLSELNSREASKEFREQLEEEGYDGVYYNGDLRQEAVAFYPNQIKSADNNNGDFSTENDDIRYSLRVDRYRDELNQWKKDNNLPKDAERPQLPVREPNESAADFLKRVKEYRKQAALWATAPTYEDHLLVSDTAQGQFNLEMQRKAVLTRIVIQDSMLAIRKAQEAIMKEVGVDKLNFAEDAYTAENRSHGKAKNEFEEYNDEFLQPLRKAYNELMQRLGKSYDNVKVYMIAKHGLERNAYIAFKYALDEDYETNEERMNAYNNYKADMDRLNNDADFEAGRIDFAAWKQRDGFIRTKYAPSYFKFRFDENGMTKDYSGLSALFDADDYEGAAADLVKEVEDANPYYTDELWYATNDATKKILRDSYNAGMMTEDNFNFVSGMYRNYIPLRGWGDTNADQVWNYVGGGKGAFNQVVKEAKGRKSLADDPIAYIENMAESAILMNNRNWVKQHLLLLAQNHRTSLLNVSKAWYIKTKDAQGNEEWIPASPQITEGMTGKQVEAALEAFEQKMEQMKQNGEATQKREHLEISYPQTNGEEREHEVRVMKGGEEYVIYVNGDPQLAQAVNNTRARKVREGLESSISAKVIARTGRYMAAAYTSMSPLFIPSNYMRDLTMTLASTAIREDARYNYLLRRNMLRHWNTFPMVLSYQNGTLREKVRNGSASRVEQMFYDFMMNGGETGFVTSVDVEDLKKKFRNDLKDLNRMAANPKKVGHIIMNSIETLNRAIEDSNRFMVYMTSIEYGRSIEEAVNNAKDVTLNFNRKGTGEHWMQNIRNLYLFINPAIQSLQTLGALAKHHRFKFTTVTTGWLASGLLAPMLNNLLMSFFGGDDDKDKYWQFTKWDRRNNFIMWIPFTKEFVKIPLAQEFRGFYGVGDMIASKLWGGEKAEESWRDYAVDLAGQIVDMLPLDPTGYDGNVLIALMPNVFRPIFELGDNVDFTGKPIFRNSEYNKYDPNFTKAYVGTPDWLVRISKMVNSIDNKYPDVQQNAIDRFGDPRFNLNNPAVVDHVLSSYLGGAYTMGSQILGVATKALNGDDIKMAEIPLASKFVSNPDDRPVSKKQGEEFWDMKERHDRAANTLSKLKKKAKVDGDYSTLDIFFGSDEYRQYKEDDKKVKKYEEDRKKEKAQETGEEYRPHKTTADDVYKSHTTPKDDFEDMKMKQLYEKLNSYKIRYEAIDGISGERGEAYYKANKAAIDAIEEIAYDKSQIASIKKGFLSDGKNTYDADGMKDIRELRKRILDVLEKANKVMLNNRK
ncbi:DNA cytosine methyltransferase [uncultured Prevotella sp.]|jgi:site-specific DNA-cytosine methylase|uniref:DNA cytosine methyltransferase n=1 Tax=uncultured Prevotella sp. TaxID=159272 RepID=UPI0027DE344E|nr:DNA cytosine methyltransferase [uncultured Prevotella sp.]